MNSDAERRAYIPATKEFIQEMQARREREDWLVKVLRGAFHVPEGYRAVPRYSEQETKEAVNVDTR